LTRQASPGNTTTNSGQSPKPPNQQAIPMITTALTQTNDKNGQPPLDTNRPFMDD
jgi:hypothetical protein